MLEGVDSSLTELESFLLANSGSNILTWNDAADVEFTPDYGWTFGGAAINFVAKSASMDQFTGELESVNETQRLISIGNHAIYVPAGTNLQIDGVDASFTELANRKLSQSKTSHLNWPANGFLSTARK